MESAEVGKYADSIRREKVRAAEVLNRYAEQLGILEQYILKSFSKYSLGQPYISKLKINFYPNEEVLINNWELRVRKMQFKKHKIDQPSNYQNFIRNS